MHLQSRCGVTHSGDDQRTPKRRRDFSARIAPNTQALLECGLVELHQVVVQCAQHRSHAGQQR
jgi:hypothetical protein